MLHNYDGVIDHQLFSPLREANQERGDTVHIIDIITGNEFSVRKEQNNFIAMKFSIHLRQTPKWHIPSQRKIAN